MAEVVLRLRIDPKTGKKSVVIDYETDADALPEEHEDEHRRLVRKVLEGAPLDGDGPLVVDREVEGDRGADVEQTEEAQREAVEQKG